MQRQPGWSNASAGPLSTNLAKRLNHTSKDEAQRSWDAKKDQVQIAQAHLSCCVKDHESLQQQLAHIQEEIVAHSDRCKEVGPLLHA